MNKYENKLNSKNNEIINNIKIIRCFQQEKKENIARNKILTDLNDVKFRLTKSLLYLNTGQNIIKSCFKFFNFINCVIDIKRGKLTPGDFITLNGTITQLMRPLDIMGMILKELDKFKVDMKNILKFKRNWENYKGYQKNLKPFLSVHAPKLSLINLSFFYPKKKSQSSSILSSLNLSFEPNKINCIVAESGQGKSTLFNLLFKLLNLKEGKVLIDGKNINEYNDKTVRDVLSLCSQENELFDDILLENVGYYNHKKIYNIFERDKSMKMLINPYSIKSSKKIGNNGSSLSGGERQRIAILRTILKSPAKILFFDESTSNLDSKNEELFFEIIRKNSKNKNIIIASHKLSTIKRCDFIFLFKNGKLIEKGNYFKLMDSNGYFRKLVEEGSKYNVKKNEGKSY